MAQDQLSSVVSKSEPVILHLLRLDCLWRRRGSIVAICIAPLVWGNGARSNDGHGSLLAAADLLAALLLTGTGRPSLLLLRGIDSCRWGRLHGCAGLLVWAPACAFPPASGLAACSGPGCLRLLRCSGAGCDWQRLLHPGRWRLRLTLRALSLCEDSSLHVSRLTSFMDKRKPFAIARGKLMKA